MEIVMKSKAYPVLHKKKSKIIDLYNVLNIVYSWLTQISINLRWCQQLL